MGRLRNSRGGGNRKTPPVKKDVASATVASSENTSETVPGSATKTTPRSGSGARGGRGAGKRSNTRAAAASVTSDPSPPAATPELDAASDPVSAHQGEEEATAAGDLELEAPSTSPDKSEILESADEVNPPFSEPEDVNNESQTKTDEIEEPVRAEVDEQEKPLADNKCEDEDKTAITTDEQETEKPPVQEKGEESVDEMKRDVSDVAADAEENLKEEESAGEGEDIKAEDEEKNMEEGVDVHGDEEIACLEKENEIFGEEEQTAGRLGEEEQVEMLDVIKERKKKKEREIFVGGLDRDATEEDVRKAFEKIGVIEDIRLHKDFTTNKNKGFAFVKFAGKEQADKAISELKNPIINGKRCGIARSEDNDTLFLGNICNTWTKEAIKQRLKDYGVEGVENINLVRDSQNEGLSRGFAFVEFSCHEYAMNAYKRLQKPDVVFGHPEWTAKVAFAEPLREPDPEVMAQVKSVFIDGMPQYWDEDRVKEHFKDYGEIEGIVLARNMPTAKRTDFGFVNYTTHEAAVACAEAVNNTELGDGKSKMKVRARLANPLPKTQAVKGGMRGGFRVGHAGMGGFSRFGRGFGRGRVPFSRGGFQGGRGFQGARGFPFQGHSRGGRFPFFPEGDNNSSNFRFRGRHPFGERGGRVPFRGDYEGMNEEFSPRFDNSRSRHGGFGRGRGRHFQMRAEQPHPFNGDFGGPSGGGHYVKDQYYYGDASHGGKRPFSTIDEPRFMEPGTRGPRPRYDLANPVAGDARYQDRGRGSGPVYPQEYYGPNYGGSGYSSSLYGGEASGSRYYY